MKVVGQGCRRCVGVCFLVSGLEDKSKYSVAMASLLLAGFSFPLRGQVWGHPG